MNKSRHAATMLARSAAEAETVEAERRQPMAGFQGERLVETKTALAPGSYNARDRTVEAVLSTGSQVRRYFFTEELEISAEAIDLSRAENGLVCLLDSHNKWETAAVLGTVTDVRIENDQLVGTLKFGETDRAREVEGMVARGELKGISIGYRVSKWEIQSVEDEHETWRATHWELLEVSIVSVPADADARVRSDSGVTPGATCEEEKMNRSNAGGAVAPATPAAEASAAAVPTSATEPTRAAEPTVAAATPAPALAIEPTASRFSATAALEFVNQARDLGVEERAQELVRQNESGEVGIEAARQAILRAAAERQRADTAPAATGPTVQVNNRNEEASRDAIVGALVARCTGESPAEASRDYMGMRLLDIARERAGVSPRERDAMIILRAANTSSDFPLLLEAAANKILLAAYGRAEPTYRAIARRRDLSDFKATKLLRVGDFPTLQAYQEDGEIKVGTINEGRETVILGSYGRILRLSRQAIVNDDLGAFDDVLGSIGGMVSRFENATFYAMKAANSGNGPKLADNVNLFNSAHGNLAASGGAVDVTTLGAGRAAMRKQKDLDGNPLNIAPKTILVGPDIETTVQQFLAPIQPAEGGKVNPFAGKLDLVVEAAITGNGWELYADPSALPVFHYGYLADAPGPRVITEEPFNVDGLAWRVTLDFYAGGTDYRGAYRNPG